MSDFTTVDDILEALDECDEEALVIINSHAVDLIKHKRMTNNMNKIFEFKVGDRVSWANTRKRDKRYGQRLTGVILSKGRTKLKVRDDDHVTITWTIPANMVTKIEQQFNPLTGEFE
jgi:hypothetical protein